MVEKSIYERGIYEYGTMHVIDSFLQHNNTFIDVGANIGLMTLLAAKKVGKNGKIYSFEANPIILEELKKNIGKNNFHNIEVRCCALGAFEGKGLLFENKFSENRGASTMLENDNSDDKNYQVPVSTLDSLFFENCNLIKIDVEGWEMEVLKGGKQFFSSTNAPAIIIECSKDRVNQKDDRSNIYDEIKKLNNYRIFKLKNKKERKGRLVEVKNEMDLPQHDNLFCFLENQLKHLPNDILSLI